jgi:hypothetical protein
MYEVPDKDPSKDASPSLEQMEEATMSSQDPIEGDITQGSEFLDDAIRMIEQPLKPHGH